MTKPATELVRVMKLVRLVFNRMKAFADEAHGDLGVTAAMRAVLETLFEEGPMTVPRIAEAKSVTRQHIQVICDDLLAQELIAAQPNPQKVRSPMMALTAKGRRTFAKMLEREAVLLDGLSQGFDRAALTQARVCLEVLAERMAERTPSGD